MNMDSKKKSEKATISPQHMKEKVWVRKVREEDDEEVFEKIFKKYYKRLHGFAYAYVGHVESAEDIVQTVFLKIWLNRKKWDPPGTVKNYIFSAVRNEAINQLKRQKMTIDAEKENLHTYNDLNNKFCEIDEIETKELREEIQTAINKLPPRCRQIFYLSRRSGLTYSEIADYLDISVNTVNTQMGRALKSLRDHLSDYLPLYIAINSSQFFF